MVDKWLTESSKKKFHEDILTIDNCTIKLNPHLRKLLEDMIHATLVNMDLRMLKPMNIIKLRNVFIDFDKNLNNVVGSKFQTNVLHMNGVRTYMLILSSATVTTATSTKLTTTSTFTITVHILTNDDNLIPIILFAINTFCNLFPYNYDGLTIYICPNDIGRTLNHTKHLDNFDKLRKQSGAFTVSGVTEKHKKTIILTKSEEIIKLLFHEMVHYIGLDSNFFGIYHDFGWAVNNGLHLSEAFAEFMSIILVTAFEAINICSMEGEDVYDYYQKLLQIEIVYSAYLSSNILKFYGYNSENFRNFFLGVGEKKYSPIPIWEYVILRTQLLLNIDEITELLIPQTISIETMIRLTTPRNNLLNMIQVFMDFPMPNNLSYVMIDLDWKLF